MIRKQNKKGDVTLENFISIVLAVLIIVGIIIGIVKIASIFMNQESKNAKNTLDLIVEKLNILEPGQKSSFIIQGFTNSENWFVSAWSAGEEGRPDKCYFDSCLCVCPLNAAGDKESDKCQSKGVCKKVEFGRISISPIDSEVTSERMKYILPASVDECKIEIIQNGDKNLVAKLQMKSSGVWPNDGA